ncbi:MAG: Zn-dependent hydrolase, partial [Clostridia bacterium]|nr:Zn-dependent hydrolase [Clostridia bacterium]
MKKTFTTVMPDRIGAFLEANLCVTELGLNITRVSYNKAIDVHTLFIEVEGDGDKLLLAEQKLSEMGYLADDRYRGSVLLVEFRLKDEPGTLRPVLELIRQYGLNISFISSQTDGSGYQAFKMGLFVENGREMSQFMHEAALLCPVQVIDYNRNERVLENTVFYITFAGEISDKLSLDEEQKHSLIVQSNAVMQMLDERNGSPAKTFEYIRLFADYLAQARGSGYHPRITRHRTAEGLEILNLEPPCGSNTTVIFCGDRLLCVDSGFSLYRREWKSALTDEIPGFEGMKKDLILSHGDVDHAGCADAFDRVFASGTCCVNFIRENSGMTAIREDNPIHAPYVAISKILSDYTPPEIG